MDSCNSNPGRARVNWGWSKRYGNELLWFYGAFSTPPAPGNEAAWGRLLTAAVCPTFFPFSSCRVLSFFSCCLCSASPMLRSFCLVTLHLAPSGFLCDRSLGHMFLDHTEVKSGMIFFFFSSCEFWGGEIASVGKNKERWCRNESQPSACYCRLNLAFT